MDRIGQLPRYRFSTTPTLSNGTGSYGAALLVVTDPSSIPAIAEASNNSANKSDGYVLFYRPNGAGRHFAWQLTTDSNVFQLQAASAAVKESQSWNTLITATGASLGFFGAAPVPRRATTAETSHLASAIILVKALNADLVAVGLKSQWVSA